MMYPSGLRSAFKKLLEQWSLWNPPRFFKEWKRSASD